MFFWLENAALKARLNISRLIINDSIELITLGVIINCYMSHKMIFPI